jgi:hypothetical protein
MLGELRLPARCPVLLLNQQEVVRWSLEPIRTSQGLEHLREGASWWSGNSTGFRGL